MAVIQPYTQWSRAEMLTLRRMYLIQGVSPKEIADKLKRELPAIYQQINRQGWAKLRREKIEAASRLADQEASDGVRDFLESVTIHGQELTEKSFAMAHATGNAKDLMALSISAKNFVGITRTGFGLDAGQASISVNLLSATITRPVKNVTPALAVETASEPDELDFA